MAYSKKAVDTAHALLPHLVAAAEAGTTGSYKTFADKIGTYHRSLDNALGYIRDDICAPRHLPSLQALVINEDDRAPGKGCIPGETDDLTPRERRAFYEPIWAEVFAYPHWNQLLVEFGLEQAHLVTP